MNRLEKFVWVVEAFLPDKTELTAGYLEGRCKPPSEVHGGEVLQKIENSCLLDTRKSNFQSLEHRD